jgi:hypothetical protein
MNIRSRPRTKPRVSPILMVFWVEESFSMQRLKLLGEKGVEGGKLGQQVPRQVLKVRGMGQVEPGGQVEVEQLSKFDVHVS